jgi:NAD-dependent SIR2 family protein deacetylase
MDSIQLLGQSIKRAQNILVLVGAGISVNAGIPDFRSPNFGIYSNYSCDVEDVFHIESFREDPVPFYHLICELLIDETTGGIKQFSPTRSHKFIGDLKKIGKLLRVYSQNIDGLDCDPVGLQPNRDVVQCHGSLGSIVCSVCGHQESHSMEEWIREVKEYLSWGSLISGKLRCSTARCDGYTKPGVILFGESLPSQFFSTIQRDAQICDLVIVIGSSLSVFPFAAIPAMLRDPATPVFIITKDFPGRPPAGSVVIDKDCDDVSQLLYEYLEIPST